jgi:hypothetical protein
MSLWVPQNVRNFLTSKVLASVEGLYCMESKVTLITHSLIIWVSILVTQGTSLSYPWLWQKLPHMPCEVHMQFPWFAPPFWLSPSCSVFVGFEVLTTVVMKGINFWDITPCSPLSVNRRFGGIYRLHLQGRRNNFSKRPASKQVASRMPPACLLKLFLRPWRRRGHVPPKRRLTLIGLHDVIFQKLILFMFSVHSVNLPFYSFSTNAGVFRNKTFMYNKSYL